MRSLLLPLALLLAGCPEQIGQQCPPETSAVGQYTLSFSPQHDGGECTLPDGGSLTADHPSQAATLCARARGGDGGPRLDLIVSGQGGVRESDLLPDGGFHFASDPIVAQGTACNCDATDTETLDGFLLTGVPDAGFALQPDGGLPPIVGLTATLTDHLTTTSPSASCLCTFPCTITYAISGTRF